MARRRKSLQPNEPLFHSDHARPVTRRDFLRQGFISGGAMVLGGGLLSLFANPRAAQAELSGDLTTLAAGINCGLGGVGGGKIPFICFDLAGGANIAGSNVLVGRNSPLDVLSTAGYSKLGLPGDMIPGTPEAGPGATSEGDHTDLSLGLPFHSDSAFLRGILNRVSPATAAMINGCVIPARSDNDTGNNPHNPMYGIAQAGGDGSVVTLIGSNNSDSGGNSMSPAGMINSEIRPTKIDRPTDVTGMVDTGNLTGILSDPDDVVAVMESVARISNHKLDRVTTGLSVPPTADAVVKDLVRCGYLKAADLADRFAGVNIDPAADKVIVGSAGIFRRGEFDSESEFRKAASVMKMVIDGYAGAGTITMGGYDYHTGDRSTGELRDLRAGHCMGACLEYAARRGVPLMLYVFSDGSLSSNGMVDNSADGRGKGVWTSDNSSTAASFFLVFSPNGRQTASRRQIGSFSSDGSVDTSSSPAANNVNLLVETVLLNYVSLNGGNFNQLFPNHGLGSQLGKLTAFSTLG